MNDEQRIIEAMLDELAERACGAIGQTVLGLACKTGQGQTVNLDALSCVLFKDYSLTLRMRGNPHIFDEIMRRHNRALVADTMLTHLAEKKFRAFETRSSSGSTASNANEKFHAHAGASYFMNLCNIPADQRRIETIIEIAETVVDMHDKAVEPKLPQLLP